MEIDNTGASGQTDVTDDVLGPSTQTDQSKETQQGGTDASKVSQGGAPGGAVTPPDDLRQAMTELAKTMGQVVKPQQQQQQEPPKQLTQEEFNKKWAIFNPTTSNPNFVKEFFNLSDDVAPAILQRQSQMLQGLIEGVVRQAVVGARNLYTDDLTAKLKAYEERLAPMDTFVQQQQAERVRTDFFTAYPALTDARYSKILNAKAAEMQTSGFKGTRAEYFKALAEGAGAAIKELVPDFDLAVKPNKSAATAPRLPRTSAGGTGGSGSGGGTKDLVKKTEDDSDAITW